MLSGSDFFTDNFDQNVRLDLTDDEVNLLCAGLVQNKAKVNFLMGLGLKVSRRPNGKPLVLRSSVNHATLHLKSAEGRTQPVLGPVWGVH